MKKILIIVLFVIVFILASCTLAPFAYLFTGMTSGGSSPESGIGTLDLNFSEFAKTEAFKQEVEYFNVFITGNDNDEERNIPSNVQNKEYKLTIGKYFIKITAHNQSGKAIGLFEENVEIKRGKKTSLEVKFDELTSLVINLPSIEEIVSENSLTSREINPNTNYWRIFIKNVDNNDQTNEWQGNNAWTYSVAADNSSGNKAEATLPGNQDYRVEVYAQKYNYNPAISNSQMTGSSTITYGYGAGEIYLVSGESTTITITMESFAATAVQDDIDVAVDDVTPRCYVSFPTSYTANRLKNTTSGGSFSSTDLNSLNWLYMTENSTPATSLSLSGNNVNKVTRMATLTGQTIASGTFSSTETVAYWFTAVDNNGVHFLFPLTNATFELTDGTTLGIDVE